LLGFYLYHWDPNGKVKVESYLRFNPYLKDSTFTIGIPTVKVESYLNEKRKLQFGWKVVYNITYADIAG